MRLAEIYRRAYYTHFVLIIQIYHTSNKPALNQFHYKFHELKLTIDYKIRVLYNDKQR